jgi:hypothetical protein
MQVSEVVGSNEVGALVGLLSRCPPKSALEPSAALRISAAHCPSLLVD